MAIKLKADIMPISYKNQCSRHNEMQDAFNLLKIIRLAERDLENGRVKPASQVMVEIKNRIANWPR